MREWVLICSVLGVACGGDDKPAPRAPAPKVKALDCGVVRSDSRVGTLELFTSSEVGPAARQHEPVSGTYKLQLHDGIREGDFTGSRWNDSTDLTLHLDDIATAFTVEDAAEEVPGGLTLGGIPLSLACKGPLVRHKK